MSYIFKFTNSTAPVPLTAFFNGFPVISPASLSFTYNVATGKIVVLDGFFGVVWELSGPGISASTPLTLAAIGGLSLSKVVGVNPAGDIIVSIQGKVRDAGGGSPDLTLDILTTFEWPDMLDAGSDKITMSQQDDIVVGLSGNDIIAGLKGDDDLSGNDGKDRIIGGSGNDTISGGADRDDLRGNGGNDTISGGGGNDSIKGHNGNDKLFGNGGRDFIIGGGGKDKMFGNAGEDTMRGEADKDKMFGGGDNDKMYGGGRADIMEGGSGNDLMLGQDGGDKMLGDSGRDRMLGGAGNDNLNGGTGNDKLFGGIGEDILRAGFGNDSLTGGSGKDVFVFKNAADEGTNTIRDFSDGSDKIQIIGESFANLTVTQAGTSTRIVTSSGTDILLENVLSGDINQNDFIFV